LVELLGLGLMPMPVGLPSSQEVSGKSTQLQLPAAAAIGPASLPEPASLPPS